MTLLLSNLQALPYLTKYKALSNGYPRTRLGRIMTYRTDKLYIIYFTYRKGVQVSNEDESQLGPGEANIQPRHVLQEPNTLPSCNASTTNHAEAGTLDEYPVLGICDILVRIRIHRSVPLTNRYGYGSGSGPEFNSWSDSFLHWL